ncbi:phosphoribosyltransferase family protein [Limnohabitans sp.]|uniref:phosphoribosyltransferase family protein n=1 Tax=Limnohabitans sp. TaxID=1907725 RepID=UPI0037BF275B
MNTSTESRICLYNTAELNVVMDNMARQTMALLPGDKPVAVVGVLRRGAPLGDMLTERMVRLHGLKPPLRLDLLVKRYADDLRLLHPDTLLTEQAQHAALDLTGHTVLLVDDVLYTGHSVLKVLPYLLQKKPACIKLVCLANRCTTRLPVHADVVGVQLAVAPDDIVECHVPPYEAKFEIELVKPARLTN